MSDTTVDTSVQTSIFYIDSAYESEIRYDLAKFLRRENDSYDPLTSKFIEALVDLEAQGQWTVSTEEYRPDLISFVLYGSTQYWWILMAYNGIVDVRTLVAGVVLKYPAVGDIENIYFNLKSLE